MFVRHRPASVRAGARHGSAFYTPCTAVFDMPTLGEIAALIGCPPPPEAQRRVTGLASLAEAGPEELSFIASESYSEQFAATRAAAIIVKKKLRLPPAPPTSAALIV